VGGLEDSYQVFFEKRKGERQKGPRQYRKVLNDGCISFSLSLHVPFPINMIILILNKA